MTRWKLLSGPISSRVEVHSLWRSKRFRRHDDQRLAEVAVHLPAQGMEQRGRRRRIEHLDVVVGVELQETLEPRRAVLGPLALVAMRQQAHQARHAQPLRFAGGHELIEIDLRAVGEIAELRFPQHQAVGIGQRVAVLEPEHAFLRQRAVDHLEGRLAIGQMLERDVALLGLLVVEHGVALREGAAADILAAQADRDSPRAAGFRTPSARRSPSRCPRPPRSPCGAGR